MVSSVEQGEILQHIIRIHQIETWDEISQKVAQISFLSNSDDVKYCMIFNLHQRGWNVWELPDENKLLHSNNNYLIQGDDLSIRPQIGGYALYNPAWNLFGILKIHFLRLRRNNFLSPSSIRLTENQIQCFLNGFGWLFLVIEVNPFQDSKLPSNAKIKLFTELQNRGEILYKGLLLSRIDEFSWLKTRVLDKIRTTKRNEKLFQFELVAQQFPKTVFQFRLAELVQWTSQFPNLFQKSSHATSYTNLSLDSLTKKPSESPISIKSQGQSTDVDNINEIVTELKATVANLTNQLSKIMQLPANGVGSSIESLDKEIDKSNQTLLDHSSIAEIEQNSEDNNNAELSPEETQILYIIETLHGAPRSQLKKILYFTDQMLRECLDQLTIKGKIRFDDHINQYVPIDGDRDE